MYYNIEVINDFNIEFIFIAVNRTQYPTYNDAGILVLNSNPEQAQNWFFNLLKIKSPQQAHPGK